MSKSPNGERTPTNYPGVGLTAEVEAFNAYVRCHRKRVALSTKARARYERLVREWKAMRALTLGQQPLTSYH